MSVCVCVCMCACARVCVLVRACVSRSLFVGAYAHASVFGCLHVPVSARASCVSVCVFVRMCGRAHALVCLPGPAHARARLHWAKRTASVRVIELPLWNVTVPPPMYTAPPSRCAHHPVRCGLPSATAAAAREPERSHICDRAGDRRAVEHERALGHVHRPSVVWLHTRGRRCDRYPAEPGMAHANRTSCVSVKMCECVRVGACAHVCAWVCVRASKNSHVCGSV